MHEYLFTYLNQKYGLKVSYYFYIEFNNRSSK